ncbi:hypothetical protein Vadar_023092 [Vaccinium darrowii]|uniref:Uncharacterized protein n=1 Tax=Vaccinium darrowii TaxID=229202 RepID=A0ACB7ZM21_9ERIC|nr:hypothetical protein Vadar_023092 [Vaccinium darrowii]
MELNLFHPLYKDTYRMDIPELSGAFLRYSKNGWLLMSRGRHSVFFFNPFTKAKIDLPDLPHNFNFTTISFSSAPTSSNCMVFVVHVFLATLIFQPYLAVRNSGLAMRLLVKEIFTNLTPNQFSTMNLFTAWVKKLVKVIRLVHLVRLEETIATVAVRSPDDEQGRRTRGLKVACGRASALHTACATRACTGVEDEPRQRHASAKWAPRQRQVEPRQRHVGARSSPRQHQEGDTWVPRQRHVSRRLTWQSSGSPVSRPSGSARPAVLLRSGFVRPAVRIGLQEPIPLQTKDLLGPTSTAGPVISTAKGYGLSQASNALGGPHRRAQYKKIALQLPILPTFPSPDQHKKTALQLPILPSSPYPPQTAPAATIRPPPASPQVQCRKIAVRPPILPTFPSPAQRNKIALQPPMLPSSPSLVQTAPAAALPTPIPAGVHHIKWHDFEELPPPSGHKCMLCKRDLSFKTEGQVYQPTIPPPVAVLPCGHTFHDHCLQLVIPQNQSKDPPCNTLLMHHTYFQPVGSSDPESSKRLGNGPTGCEEVKGNKWFIPHGGNRTV